MVIKHQQKQKHYLLLASMVLTALYEVKETEISVFSKKTIYSVSISFINSSGEPLNSVSFPAFFTWPALKRSRATHYFFIFCKEIGTVTYWSVVCFYVQVTHLLHWQYVLDNFHTENWSSCPSYTFQFVLHGRSKSDGTVQIKRLRPHEKWQQQQKSILCMLGS